MDWSQPRINSFHWETAEADLAGIGNVHREPTLDRVKRGKSLGPMEGVY